MGDLLVQRLEANVPNTGATSGITPVASLDNAFVLLSNNRYQSAGNTAESAINYNADDLTGAAVLTDVSTVTFYRESTGVSDTMKFAAEVIEYVGPPGGDNEFVVLGRYSTTLNTGTATSNVTVAAPSGSRHKCIPFITGISCNRASQGAARSTAVILQNTDTNCVVYVGGAAGDTTVYFTLVEFTGSNWEVYHGGTVGSGDTGTINLVEESNGTGTAATVTDWDTALIFHQPRADSASDTNIAIADHFPVYSPGSDTSSVSWTYDANHDGASNFHFVHVLRHPNLSIQRITDTQSSAGAMNVSIPSALSDISQAMVLVTRRSSGTGTAYARGWVNARITSTSNVELWCHRSGNTISTEIQVADLTGISSAVRRVFIV
jgi:hypothetical protein